LPDWGLIGARHKQVALVSTGRADEVVLETRLWDEAQQCTYSMRRKEGLADYRFFPEPDLPPVVLQDDWVEGLRVRAWCRRLPARAEPPQPCLPAGWLERHARPAAAALRAC
jgi:hypothetical protein